MAETTKVTDLPTEMPMMAPDSYGPFADYTIQTTPHGQFGLPAGHRMTFEAGQVYLKKLDRTVEMMVPVYEKVPINDPRLKPITERTDEDRQMIEQMKARI